MVGEEPDLSIEDMSLASFNFHGDSVYCAALHPTRPGIVLSGGGDDRAFLWKYVIPSDLSVLGATENSFEQYGKGIEFCIELPGHTDTVTAVGFNFDGTLALTGGYDGVINIWSLTHASSESEPAQTIQPTLLHKLEGPEDVEWATWHSKGNAVLAGSKDGTIWMWLANTGQCVQVFAGHDGGVTCGLFTLDGKTVCSGGEDGTVRLWAPKTGACKHNFSGEMSGGHSSSVTCIAGSEDGDLLVTGGFDGEVHLFHVSGKRLVKKFVHSQPVKIETPVGTDGTALPTPPPSSGDMDEDDWGDDDEEDEEKEMVQSVECVGISRTELKYEVFHSAPLISCHVSDGWLLVERIRT
jgi:angio-associated migratory cell protein